jgi:hypothetical protein
MSTLFRTFKSDRCACAFDLEAANSARVAFTPGSGIGRLASVDDQSGEA